MASILIVDDDYSLFALLSEFLGNSGFDCTHAPDAPDSPSPPEPIP